MSCFNEPRKPRDLVRARWSYANASSDRGYVEPRRYDFGYRKPIGVAHVTVSSVNARVDPLRADFICLLNRACSSITRGHTLSRSRSRSQTLLASALDVLGAEISFGKQTIVLGAQQPKIIGSIGTTPRPRLLVVNLQQLSRATASPFARNERAAPVVALGDGSANVARDALSRPPR
jgi:hypothetical protein